MGYIFFSALGALAWGFNSVVQRRAVIRVLDATIGILITVPLSVVFFMLILLAMGQVSNITSFSWQSYGWLAAAGIIHFIVGPSLSYALVQDGLVDKNADFEPEDAVILFRLS